MRGYSREATDNVLSLLPVTVIAADSTLALEAGHLRPITSFAGLSLGDRFCLALARQLDRPVLTADRNWVRVADAVGVEIELIR